MKLRGLIVLLCLAGAPGASVASDVPGMNDVRTVADGRAHIRALYATYEALVEFGWEVDVVAHSAPESAGFALPIIALRSPRSGPATWILSGIHGEEPAGPNAIASALDAIAEMGTRHPVVLLPLCNPHGYARNWRYLNRADWEENADVRSVGDSSHLLLAGDGRRPRSDAPSNPEAAAIGDYILATMADYPPRVSIDLHEDDMLDRGYVYSQGVGGIADPLASAAVAVFEAQGIPIQMSGTTRFDETISGGIIGPVSDSSIDELMSAVRIVRDGTLVPGPAAHTVLVFETPARALALPRRIAAHEALLRRLLALISVGGE